MTAAAKEGDVGLPEVQALLAAGVSPRASHPLLGTALYAAVAAGNEAIVRMLLAAGASPRRGKDGAPPLHIAAALGNVGIMRTLLAAGASAKELDSGYGRTPLSWAAAGGSVEAVQLLLAGGVNPRDLCKAACEGDMASLRNWLEHTATPVDAASSDGMTPLMDASRNGHAGVIKVLLRAGADPKLPNRLGSTALELAESNGHDAAAAVLRAASGAAE